MKTLTNLAAIACAATCFGCATGNQIHPSENYQTEKHIVGNIQTISTSSSIDIVYHQTSGSPYAEIYASDNVMPYIVLKESNGELTAYYKEGTSIIGENRCRIDVYAPSVTSFITQASGDISIPEGLKTNDKVQIYSYGSGDIECPSAECSVFMAETSASGDIDIQTVTCREIQGSINASGDLTINEVTCHNASLSVNASGDCSISHLECEEYLQGSINASGNLTLSGKCNKATLSVNASGDLNAYNLKVNDVCAEVNGSGDLSCHASRSITAKTFGSGSLTFSGNPSHVKTEGKNIHKRQ